VNIIDIRQPMKPLHQLRRHAFPVNAVAWAPHSEIHIATAGEDMNAFIWNLESARFSSGGDPLLE
jgi:WD40 repeat protein